MRSGRELDRMGGNDVIIPNLLLAVKKLKRGGSSHKTPPRCAKAAPPTTENTLMTNSIYLDATGCKTLRDGEIL